MTDTPVEQPVEVITLAADLTAAWLANPNSKVGAEDVPAFLQKMHDTITALNGPTKPAPDYKPVVSVRSSVKPDHIVSLIDGRKYKSLKRHLKSHGLTPKAYRERYGLKADYPMVAPAYSEARRQIAARLGLGRKVQASRAAAAKPEGPATAPAKPAKAAGKAIPAKGGKRPRLSVKWQDKANPSKPQRADAPKPEGADN